MVAFLGPTDARQTKFQVFLHYVRGGRGSAVILIHGFPEDWVEYRAVMPRLAQRFTVVTVDLSGIGRSAPAAGGYDAANPAAFLGWFYDLGKFTPDERAYYIQSYGEAFQFDWSEEGLVIGWASHVGGSRHPEDAEPVVPLTANG